MHPVQINRIIAAVDFSDWTAPVLHTAREIAARYSAKITTVHSDMFLPPPYFTVGDMDKISSALNIQREAAHRYLRETAQRELGADFSTDARIVEAYPAEGILRTADTLRADLIVMGAKHRPLLEATILGTTSVRVVRHAVCPVLTVIRPYIQKQRS